MIKPLEDRVVVKRLQSADKTEGGLYIPPTNQKKSDQGEVLAVGPGRMLESGQVAPMSVKVGDIVLFMQFGGQEVEIEGEKLLVLSERELLAVL